MSNFFKRIRKSVDRGAKANPKTRQSPSTGQNMMQAGRDLSIRLQGGTSSQINATFNQLNPDNQSSGIHILSKMIATDAIHDACERYPPPKVHPGTRTKILEVLTAWINDLDSECQVFWLHGPAGVGKSAILQALAELLMSPKGPLVASFFFGKGQGKRGSGDHLFSTVAYQLAINVNGLRAYVDEVMQSNPALPTKSMEVQLRALIIEPFQRLDPHPCRVQTVIIDGLDECQGDKTQESILQLIGDALTKHQLPLRFLIASRPEPHIRHGFDSSSLLPITNRLMLHDDFRTGNDIEKYLQDGFADICLRSCSMAYVEMPWPGKDVIDTLTRHACGQFIYAATVLKFVGQKSTYPPKQLDIVLRPHLSRGKPFSDLDSLYSQILLTHPDPDTLLRILSTIIAFSMPQHAVVIEDILEMGKGEVLYVLEGLHSLLGIPDNDILQPAAASGGGDSEIRIHHASFRDYLLDKHRSGDFYIDGTTLDTLLSTSICSMISNSIIRSSQKGFTDGSSCGLDSKTLRYISHHLYSHLQKIDNFVGLSRVAAEFEQALGQIHNASGIPFKALYRVINSLSLAINLLQSDTKGQGSEMCGELMKVQKTYVAALHVYYRSAISSANLDTFLASLPGVGVIVTSLPINLLEYVYKLEGQQISSILKEWERFVDYSVRRKRDQETQDVVRLSLHVINFLADKESAGAHYHNPIVAHFMICHNTISFLFPPSWQDIPDPVSKFSWSYRISRFFAYHLTAPYKGGLPEIQDTVNLLDLLDRINYYDPNWPCLHDGDRITTLWETIKHVLLWLVKRRHDLCDTLAKRCTQLYDKILSQVLCLLLEETEFGLIKLVTLREPFRSFETGDGPLQSFSKARNNHFSDQLVAPIPGSGIPVSLSDDMLLLELHTFELDEYLTDAERAGRFYIDAYDYFDSLFDMCMERQSYLGEFDTQSRSTQKRDCNLVTACLSYLVHAQASRELYASLWPIYRWRELQKVVKFPEILKLLKASPHTPPDLHDAWEEEWQDRHETSSISSWSSLSSFDPICF